MAEPFKKNPLNPNAPPYYPIKIRPPPYSATRQAEPVTWRRRGPPGLSTWRVRRGCGVERERESGVMIRRSWGYNRLKKHEVLPLDLDKTTTVLIKNIPKEYTREMLLNFLDEHCKLMNAEGDHPPSAFDFLYLPFDFRTRYNKGFAFVNFSSSRAVKRFYQACDNQGWENGNSNKIRKIVAAINQGKEALLEYSSRSKFHCDSDEFLPISFSPPRDGSDNLVRETTLGTRIPNENIGRSMD